MKKKSKAATRRSPSKTARATSSRKVPKPTTIIPGEIIPGKGDIIVLHGRQTIELAVSIRWGLAVKWVARSAEASVTVQKFLWPMARRELLGLTMQPLRHY